MQQPPNNGQSNWQQPWQGSQPQHLPQQPWGLPPEQPGQQQSQPWTAPQYNQPTQGWQSPLNYPPFPPPVPKRRTFQQKFNALSRKGKMSVGCVTLLVILSMCICSAVVAANGSTNQQSSQPTPTTAPTQHVVILAATSTVAPPTSTAASTDTPTPMPTPTLTPRPTVKPTPTQPIVQRPTPTPKPHCVGINNNPWCYDFNPGNVIDYPPSGFCNYFNCIPTFYGSDDPGDGYIIQCVDGTYSQSGGERGACSSHGGESRILYSH